MSKYVHDMRQVLAELIDEQIPDLSIPTSILKTYLVQTLAQEGGRDLLGSFVSPLVGKTVGTALVEYRHHRVCNTLKEPRSLLAWMLQQEVDLNGQDAYGDTALLRSLSFELPSLATSNVAALAEAAREMVWITNTFESLFERYGIDPLVVDGNGFGLLQCEGQGIGGKDDPLPYLHQRVEQSLEKIDGAVERWNAVRCLEAQGVAKQHQGWWEGVRAFHHSVFMEESFPEASASRPRAKL